MIKACDAGAERGCTSAAEQLHNARGVPRDSERVIILYEKACSMGQMIGCTNAGELLLDPNGDAQVNARAAAAFTSACDGGNGYGCLKLGVSRYEGWGVAKDVAAAREAFKRACDAGVQDGCHVEAQLAQAKGKRVPLELTTAVDKMNYEGMLFTGLSCRMREQGLMALGDVLSEIARNKAAFDKCSAATVPVQATWRASGGRVREVTIEGASDPKLGACVSKALRKAKVKATGECRATISVGGGG